MSHMLLVTVQRAIYFLLLVAFVVLVRMLFS